MTLLIEWWKLVWQATYILWIIYFTLILILPTKILRGISRASWVNSTYTKVLKLSHSSMRKLHKIQIQSPLSHPIIKYYFMINFDFKNTESGLGKTKSLDNDHDLDVFLLKGYKWDLLYNEESYTYVISVETGILSHPLGWSVSSVISRERLNSSPVHVELFTRPIVAGVLISCSLVSRWVRFFSQTMICRHAWLIHLPPAKLAAISQTTCSNELSWIKIIEFQIKFHWNMFRVV